MPPIKPAVWRIESPAFRCPHCKKPVRAVYYGRWQFWGLKGGRGWKNRGHGEVGGLSSGILQQQYERKEATETP